MDEDYDFGMDSSNDDSSYNDSSYVMIQVTMIARIMKIL